jgi:hypothetical protein
LRSNIEVLHLQTTNKGESAKARRRAIVRMTFQFGTKREQIVPGEICPRNLVQGMKHAESHGYAAAKPTSNWNVASNIAGKLKSLALSGGEKFSCCISNHSADSGAFSSADRYIVIKRKSHPETIEAGPEIRSAGGNAHRDLLHSPSLSCAPNAARQAIMRD